jgi:hypothetical protein
LDTRELSYFNIARLIRQANLQIICILLAHSQRTGGGKLAPRIEKASFPAKAMLQTFASKKKTGRLSPSRL